LPHALTTFFLASSAISSFIFDLRLHAKGCFRGSGTTRQQQQQQIGVNTPQRVVGIRMFKCSIWSRH
jgi:hypothetical protein